MSWATVDEVAAHVGATADDAMSTSLDAAQAWCQRQRPDLNPYADPGPDVHYAVLIYAGLLWRQKASPQGYATYSEYGGDVSTADAMTNVYRLLGARRPKAR